MFCIVCHKHTPIGIGSPLSSIRNQSLYHVIVTQLLQTIPQQTHWQQLPMLVHLPMHSPCCMSGQHFNDIVRSASRMQFAKAIIPNLTCVNPPTQNSVATTKGLIFDQQYIWVGDGGNHRLAVIPLP